MNIETLLSEIESAFFEVGLEDGVGLYQAEAIDNYRPEQEIEIAKSKDRGAFRSWKAIPSDLLEKHYSALCFVDSKGLRFLLPAYMTYTLQNYSHSSSASIDAASFALGSSPAFVDADVDSVFTKRQYKVIARFLKYLVVSIGDEHVDVSQASDAYRKIWENYDDEMV